MYGVPDLAGPVFRSPFTGADTHLQAVVHVVCATYANHHYGCPDCARTNWYSPDSDLLCATGRKLFRKWEKTAATYLRDVKGSPGRPRSKRKASS